MVKSPNNPEGLPLEVRKGGQPGPVLSRRGVGPFYGFNRPDAKPLEGVIHNWWRQGMVGGAKAHYDGIKAFSETDLTDGKPGNEALHKTCFPCHEPGRNRDFIFTRYAPTP